MDKKCPTCKEDLALDKYWKGQSSCILCTKHKQNTRWLSRTPKKRLEQHLKYKYGITPQDFADAFKKQDGKCSICTKELPNLLTYEDKQRDYAIDHNHETGAFRGILCLNCNSLLGMAQDNTEILKSAITYLEQNGNYSTFVVARKKK